MVKIMLKKGIYNLILGLFSLPQKRSYFFKILANYFFAFLKISKNVPYPIEMQIEPSTVCNLHCQICSLRNNSIPKNRFLNVENFSKLLEELKSLKSINFTGMGESLLNPNLAEMIKLASSNSIETSLITNAMLLNQKMINSLIDSGLDKISISMESSDSDIYEKFRVGAKFKTLNKNLDDLKNEIKKRKSKLKIIINVVLLPETLSDVSHIRRIIDFAHNKNIKIITLQFPHNIYNFGLNQYFNNNGKTLHGLFDDLKNYSKKKDVSINFPQNKIKKKKCYYPWIYPQITASGELMPCCIIPQFGKYDEIVKKFSFGNVFEKSFSKVWNSPKAILFRRKLAKNPNNYCLKCSKYLGIL